MDDRIGSTCEIKRFVFQSCRGIRRTANGPHFVLVFSKATSIVIVPEVISACPWTIALVAHVK